MIEEPGIIQEPTSTESSGPSVDFSLVKQALSSSEAGGRYDAIGVPVQSHGGDRALGRYQFMPKRLAELGYLDVNPQDFLRDPDLQEQAMDKHVDSLVGYAVKTGLMADDTPAPVVAGLLWAGHLGGPGAMSQAFNYLKSNGLQGIEAIGPADTHGTTVGKYFKQGYNSYLKAAGFSSPDKGFVPNGMFSARGELDKSLALAPARKPVTYLEAIKKNWSGADSQQVFGITDEISKQTQKAFEELVAAGVSQETLLKVRQDLTATRVDPTKRRSESWQDFIPGLNTVTGAPTNLERLQKSFDNALAEIKALNPDAKISIKSFADVLSAAGKELRNREEVASDVMTRASWGQWFTGHVAGFASFMADPANLAALPFGVGGGQAVTKMIAPVTKAGKVAADVVGQSVGFIPPEISVQTDVQSLRGQVGLESGIVQGAENVAIAGAGAGAFTGVAHGVKAVVNVAAKYTGKGISKINERLFNGKAKEVAEDIEATGGNPGPVREFEAIQERNPAGKDAAAVDDVSKRMSAVEDAIESDVPVESLPLDNTGVKMKIDRSEDHKALVSTVKEEEVLATKKVKARFEELHSLTEEAGDLSPEQIKKIPVLTKEDSIQRPVVSSQQEKVNSQLGNRIDDVELEGKKYTQRLTTRVVSQERKISKVQARQDELSKGLDQVRDSAEEGLASVKGEGDKFKAETTEKISETSTRIKDVDDKIGAVEEEQRSLRDQLSLVEEQSKSGLDTERSAALKQSEVLVKRLDDVDANLVSLKQDRVTFTDELDQLRSSVSTEQQALLKDVGEEFTAVNTRLSDVSTRLEANALEISKVDTSRQKLQGQLDKTNSLLAEKDKLSSDKLQSLTRQKVVLNSKLLETNKRLSKLESEAPGLAKEQAELTSKLDQLNTKQAEGEERVGSLEESRELTTQELARVRTTQETTLKFQDELDERLGVIQEQTLEQRQLSEGLRSQFDEAGAKIEDYKEQLSGIKERMKTADEGLREDLQQQAKVLKDDIDHLSEVQSSLKEAQDISTTKIDDLSTKTQVLSDQSLGLKDSITKLETLRTADDLLYLQEQEGKLRALDESLQPLRDAENRGVLETTFVDSEGRETTVNLSRELTDAEETFSFLRAFKDCMNR